MLDIMRKKKRLKATVLWVVIIAVGGSMVIWGVALNMGGDPNRPALGSNAIDVSGRKVSMKEFFLVYNQYVRSLQASSQTELDPKLLRSFGLYQQIVDELIQQEVLEILAEQLGLTVTEDELRQAILTHPQLQMDGKFIGLNRYKQLLAMEGIPFEKFEEDMRHRKLVDKLIKVIADSLEISEQELREEFSRTNQKAVVDYVLLEKDTFKKRVRPTDADLQAYYDENKDAYKIEEKRRARYLLIPTSQILPNTRVSEEEIKNEWAQNPLPETVEAAHIVFLINDPAEEPEIRARAEEVLKQAKAGKDFAALAREYSEDTGNAEQGGYIGTIQRGIMPQEFEDVAFSLEPGEISDLVRTQDYGYHIIKVFRHDKPTLQENRSDLFTTIQFRKAKDAARQKAEEAAKLAATQEDFNAIAGQLDVEAEIDDTGLFAKDENPYSIGISQALLDDIFRIEEVGALGNVVEHTLGFAFARLEEKQMARPAQFDESREEVRNDFLDDKAEELMKAEAVKLSEEALEQENLANAARKLGFGIKTSPDFTVDGSPDPEIPDQTAFNAIAFELEVGSVSQPIEMPDAVAVLQIKSRSPFDETAFENERNDLYDQMLSSLQMAYLDDYVRSFREELQESGKIEINPQVFQDAEGLPF